MKIITSVLLTVLSLSSANLCALVVLQYHHISDQAPRSTSVSPVLFEQHLDYLEEAKFNIISMDQLKSLLDKKARLPDRTVLITFDDGYRSVYTEAYPRLKARGWPFTVFINTRPHDQKSPRYIQWDQLREMAKNKVTIANHSDSHPHLIRHQSYENHKEWFARKKREITFAQQRIQKEIGRAPRVFAYPYGEHDEPLRRMLASMGYIAFGQQSGPVAKNSDLQALPRFAFGGKYGQMEDFKVKVNSLPFPQARVKVTGEGGKVLNDPELPKDIGRPILRIASPMMSHIRGASCYSTAEGKITAERRGGVLMAQATRDLPVGRSRYNCTAQTGGGRYFWYSQMFIRRHKDGRWYNE